MLRRTLRRADVAASMKMRRAPLGVHKKDMHSFLLTEHPMTLKAQREEAAFKQRMLAERGLYDEDARKEAEKLAVEIEKTAEGKRVSEYKYAIVVGFIGYMSAHFLVFNYFYGGEEVRLPYDPVNGFVEDLQKKRKEMEAVDTDFVHMMRDSIAAGRKKRPSLLE